MYGHYVCTLLNPYFKLCNRLVHVPWATWPQQHIYGVAIARQSPSRSTMLLQCLLVFSPGFLFVIQSDVVVLQEWFGDNGLYR